MRKVRLKLKEEKSLNKKQKEIYNSLIGKFYFEEDQRYQIELGLINGIDPTIYSNPNFLDIEMEQIRIGLEQGLDVSLYAKEDFDLWDMFLIRTGLKYGFDFSNYKNIESSNFKSEVKNFLNEKYKESNI